jgi:hypothetical protein
MTRAKHHLDIMVPQRFYVHQQSRSGDRHLYASRTRFVPDALLGLFEQRDLAGAGGGAGGRGCWEARGACRYRGPIAGKMAVRFRRWFVGL